MYLGALPFARHSDSKSQNDDLGIGWIQLAREGELASVDAGLGLRDAAVVNLDLLGRAGGIEAGGCAGAAGNAQALGVGGCSGAECDGDIGCGVSVVADFDCDQPSCGRAGARGEPAGCDVDDGEVGHRDSGRPSR